MKLYRNILIITFLLMAAFSASAQKFAIKTNLVGDATTSIALGVEPRLGKRFTLDIPVSYNPWKFSDETRFKHILLQPELRYWFCDTYNRSFIGVHVHGAFFNISNIDLSWGTTEGFKDHRYQGWLYGAGISYGYDWILGKHWNLEATIGAGYARMIYDRYVCTNCGFQDAEGNYDYWGITKVAISLVYLF